MDEKTLYAVGYKNTSAPHAARGVPPHAMVPPSGTYDYVHYFPLLSLHAFPLSYPIAALSRPPVSGPSNTRLYLCTSSTQLLLYVGVERSTWMKTLRSLRHVHGWYLP